MQLTYKKIKKIVKYLLTPKRYYGGVKMCSRCTEFVTYFIVDRLKLSYKKGKIAVFSASSIPEIMRMECAKVKIFQTRENTHVPESYWQQFEDIHLKEPSLNLSLGFDYYDHPRYLRFPYWLEHMFGPTATKGDIERFVQDHNISNATKREKGCAFICKKDYFGDRAQMADLVAQIMPMSYPSDFRHNDDDMRGKYGDNKIEYLRQFRFNLCPENSNNRGYVTEKIFEAIKAGCVPIYWGNEGYPEPDILNPKAIVYLDKDNPEEGLALLRKLYEDPKTYADFASQPKFLRGAADMIYAFYERLEIKMRNIL